MKNAVWTAALFLLVSCQQEKIGYVDNVKLMDEYQEKIDADVKFKSEEEVLTKKRDSLSQAYQLEMQAFQTKSQSMSQKKAQEEYGLLQQKGQFLGQQLQQEAQIAQTANQAILDSIISTVKKEVKGYGKANGYSYILTGGDGGSVLYGNDANNVTDEVVKILNDKYKKVKGEDFSNIKSNPTPRSGFLLLQEENQKNSRHQIDNDCLGSGIIFSNTLSKKQH